MFCFALGSDCGHGLLDLFRVAYVVALYRLEILIKLIDQRQARGYVQFYNGLVRNIIKILHQRAQAVAVGCDQYALAGFDRRRYGLVPVWQKPRDGVLETLCVWDILLIEILIARILTRVSVVRLLERWRLRVVAPPPYKDLVLSKLDRCLAFVEALQGPLMALVQPPASAHRYPLEVHLLKSDP